MPCLNEADTLADVHRQGPARACATRASTAKSSSADNGSTDGSPDIAERARRPRGARRRARLRQRADGRHRRRRAAATSSWATPTTATTSARCRSSSSSSAQGYDLVQGCRLPSGGGTSAARRDAAAASLVRQSRAVVPGPAGGSGRRSRRLLRHARVQRELYDRLDLRCTGMEFATEMIIKASLYGERIAEVPITLHPDGRKAHPPHLRTFRDGWRTLRFFLMFSPRWLFLVPGLLLIAARRCSATRWRCPACTVGGVTFDAHTLLFASLALIGGSRRSRSRCSPRRSPSAKGCCRSTAAPSASSRS